MWSKKYEPQDLDVFIGKKVVDEVRGKSEKNLLIHGPIGTGKSLILRLLAKELDVELFEISDENIGEALSISNTQGLFGQRRILLVEDIERFGDMKGLGKLIDKGASQVFATTSDFSNRRITTVKKKFETVGLRRPLPSSISNHLKSICEKEGVVAPKPMLDIIAKSAQGDVRVAITNLQTIVSVAEDLYENDFTKLLSDRDKKGDIYKALSIIFGGRDFEKVIHSTWSLDEQPRDVLWWVDENTPKLYRDPYSIAKCFSALSRADIFLGRIMRRQTWGYLRYANVLMTAGVNCARPQKINFTQYSFPGYFMSMSRTKGSRRIENEIGEILSPQLHVSKKIIKSEYIPLFKNLLNAERITKEELCEDMGLQDEHVEYLENL